MMYAGERVRVLSSKHPLLPYTRYQLAVRDLLALGV